MTNADIDSFDIAQDRLPNALRNMASQFESQEPSDDDELLAQDAVNSGPSEETNIFSIKPGGQAQKDFDVRTILRTYPSLFPYGLGCRVIEGRGMGLERWIKWALQYHDGRFRKHPSFVFNVFGIIQKRNVAERAQLQMKNSDFAKHAKDFTALTQADFAQAAKEEASRKPFSNPVMRRFRSLVTINRSQVIGSDASRAALRPKIWGNSVVLGQPTIWATFNQAYEHDPVAQVIAGSDINLDDFNALLAGSASDRGRTISSDPYASAKFFDTTVTALCEHVFGLKKKYKGLEKVKGVFGEVEAYFGVVESQGKYFELQKLD